jgi:hypothetical protein
MEMAFGEVKSGPQVWWYGSNKACEKQGFAARVSHTYRPVTSYFPASLNVGKRHGKVEV